MPAAEADFDGLALYLLEHGSLAVFERFHVSVRETLRLLAQQPELGERLPPASRHSATFRQWHVAGFSEHLVIYRQVDGYLEVARVLHAKRDIDDIAF